MKVSFNTSDFTEKMFGLTGYAEQFLITISDNESKITEAIAEEALDSAYIFVDTMARMYPDRLHHVYEWGKPGDASLRLYEFENHKISKNIYQIRSKFLDSKVPSLNSNQIFIKKASVMETGQQLTIQPRSSRLLVFEIDNEIIFTPNQVKINNPGGNVAGKFGETMKDFETYFQSTFPRSDLFLRLKKIGRAFRPGKRPNKASGKSDALKFILELHRL